MSGGRIRNVLLAGLAVGVLLNLGELLVNQPLLGDSWQAAMRALGVPAEPSPVVLAVFATMGVLCGLATVWIYSLLRVSWGPGPRSALLAAGLIWFLTAGWGLGAPALLGLYPAGLVAATLALGLIEFAVAGLLGVWLLERVAR